MTDIISRTLHNYIILLISILINTIIQNRTPFGEWEL